MSSDDGWVTERLRVGEDVIHCRRGSIGDGVPIIHIHGFGISGEYLMPTARLLARRWVNVVPDLPGYGRSERRRHVLNIPELAEALMALLDALAIERAVLLGNSMGCPVALEAAHAAPDRVEQLILVSPAGGVQNQPLVRALAQLGQDVARESPRMFPVALPDYAKFGPVNGLRLFHELTRFPSLDRLVHTPAPTLAVLGVRDPLMPSLDRVQEIARHAPDSLTVVRRRQGRACGELQPPGGARGRRRGLAGRRDRRRHAPP